jgi:hypothetical protein
VFLIESGLDGPAADNQREFPGYEIIAHLRQLIERKLLAAGLAGSKDRHRRRQRKRGCRAAPAPVWLRIDGHVPASGVGNRSAVTPIRSAKLLMQ